MNGTTPPRPLSRRRQQRRGGGTTPGYRCSLERAEPCAKKATRNLHCRSFSAHLVEMTRFTTPSRKDSGFVREAAAEGKDEYSPFRGGEAGFTLLETIVTLALISLISLILFQSVTTYWSNMQRVSAAFDRANSMALREAIFRNLVGEMVPGWPETPSQVFRADEDSFSGLTNRPFDTRHPRLLPLAVSLERGTGISRLIVRTGESAVVMIEGLEAARIDYRGMDGLWRSSWPPEANPGNGFFNDGDFFATPQLPESIRLEFVRGGKAHSWIVTLENAKTLPFRVQDMG